MATQKFLTVLCVCASRKSHFNISPPQQRHHVAKIKNRASSLHAVILQLSNDPKIKFLLGLGHSEPSLQSTCRVKKKAVFDEILSAIQFVRDECKYVKFAGLMTIGAAENSKKSAELKIPNPDFEKE